MLCSTAFVDGHGSCFFKKKKKKKSPFSLFSTSSSSTQQEETHHQPMASSPKPLWDKARNPKTKEALSSSLSESSLLHPNQFLDAQTQQFPIPKALSPSAILEFQKCPQSFLFQYIFGLRQPPSRVLAKGTMVHAALEQIFDLDPDDRTLQNLQNLLRRHWSQHRNLPGYKELFHINNNEESSSCWDLQAEITWGKEALQLLQNYVQLEDPRGVPTPAQRELWVRAYFASKTSNITATTSSNSDKNSGQEFLVRGIIDRLDLVSATTTTTSHNNNNMRQGKNSVVTRLVDYKTGAAPVLKYTPAVNARIEKEAFFQLMIYALLLRESQKDQTSPSMELRFLRIVYLKDSDDNGAGAPRFMDWDLGETAAERDAQLDQIRDVVVQVHSDIMTLLQQQQPLLWSGCNRDFCYCHKCRTRFYPGTVWEPATAMTTMSR